MPRFLQNARLRFSNDFAVQEMPVPDQPEPLTFHYLITLVEPAKDEGLLGQDLTSEKTRLKAALEAASFGKPMMSGHFGGFKNAKYGLPPVILVPMYRPGAHLNTPEERREALVRFICAPLLAENFFNSVLDRTAHQLDVDVFEGASTRAGDWIFGTRAQPAKDFRVHPSDRYGRALNHTGLEPRPGLCAAAKHRRRLGKCLFSRAYAAVGLSSHELAICRYPR